MNTMSLESQFANITNMALMDLLTIAFTNFNNLCNENVFFTLVQIIFHNFFRNTYCCSNRSCHLAFAFIIKHNSRVN